MMGSGERLSGGSGRLEFIKELTMLDKIPDRESKENE